MWLTISNPHLRLLQRSKLLLRLRHGRKIKPHQPERNKTGIHERELRPLISPLEPRKSTARMQYLPTSTNVKPQPFYSPLTSVDPNIPYLPSSHIEPISIIFILTYSTGISQLSLHISCTHTNPNFLLLSPFHLILTLDTNVSCIVFVCLAPSPLVPSIRLLVEFSSFSSLRRPRTHMLSVWSIIFVSVHFGFGFFPIYIYILVMHLSQLHIIVQSRATCIPRTTSSTLHRRDT